MLLEAVQKQTDLQPVIHEGEILRHLPAHLLEAGEKVVQSNAELAQQFRRMLDEQSIAQHGRVRAIVADIKHLAFRVPSDPPDESAFIALELPPQVHLVIEHGLWEPTDTFSASALPIYPYT